MLEFPFRHHRHRRHEECSERDLLLLILLDLEEIQAALGLLNAPNVVSGTVTFQGEDMSDGSVPAGTTSEPATASFLDADNNVQTPASPPVWAVSDESLASVAPDPADPTGLTALVTLNASDSGVSVGVTATATNADGTVAVASGTLTVEAAVPPPTPDVVSGDIAFG